MYAQNGYRPLIRVDENEFLLRFCMQNKMQMAKYGKIWKIWKDLTLRWTRSRYNFILVCEMFFKKKIYIYKFKMHDREKLVKSNCELKLMF